MPPGGPRGIGGDVKAVTSSSVTVATSTGSLTYFITATTTVTDQRPGAKSESLSLGENVRVVPSPTDSSVAASITIVPATIGGRVSAITGNTISVTDTQGVTATIQVNADTAFAKTGANASITDVRVGSFIFAIGRFGTSPSTLDATTVGIGMPAPGTSGPGNGHGPGRWPDRSPEDCRTSGTESASLRGAATDDDDLGNQVSTSSQGPGGPSLPSGP